MCYNEAVNIAGHGLSELAGAVTDIPTAGLTSDILCDKLVKSGASEDLIEEITNLLGEADRIRFAGTDLDATYMDNLLIRFKQTAERLERIR